VAGRDHHPDGRTRSPRASNVVHLRPRQWLESEDELVPIGRAATESGAGDAPSPEEPVPIAPESNGRAASDFWGEDAAYVQDAVEATAPEASAPEAPAPEAPSDAVAAPGGPPLAFRRRLSRAPALAVIAIAAAMPIAVVINGFGSATAVPRTSSSSSLHASAGTRSTAAVARIHTTKPASQHRRTARSVRRERSRSTAEHPRAHSAHRRRAVATTAVDVRDVTPASPPPASTTYRTVTPTQATRPSAPSPAGPTGPGSLIGPGTSSSG